MGPLFCFSKVFRKKNFLVDWLHFCDKLKLCNLFYFKCGRGLTIIFNNIHPKLLFQIKIEVNQKYLKVQMYFRENI